MGNLYVIATPIGNLNDFSSRAVETLNKSDYVLVEDTRQTIKLFNHFGIKKKMKSYHKFNEKEKINTIISDLKQGMTISLVSDAGTPCISDPGYLLIKQVRENNLNVFVIPGCSAVISALSVGGLDTSSFTFYGFVPIDNRDRKKLFDDIKVSNIGVKVLYESPKRILRLLFDLKKEIPACVVCVCSEMTKIHEKYFYGKIDDVVSDLTNDTFNNRGEYVVLVSNNVVNKPTEQISIEALIIDYIIKENITIKEAINLINSKYDNLSKKEIYNASLKLKEITSKFN